jgi:PAS domain S-box-containing protein
MRKSTGKAQGLADRDTTVWRPKEATSWLAAIVASSTDAIIGKSCTGIVTSFNLAAERLFGYRADEIIGQSIRILIPADRQEEEDSILARIVAGKKVEHYETVRLHKNGNPIQVSISVSPVHDARGRIVGAAKIARDISEQKWAEEALRRNAETFATLVEQSPLGIYTVDSQFRIRNVSAGAMPAFRNVRPLIGRDFGEVMRILWPDRFADEAIRVFRHTLETGEPYVSPGLTETRNDTGTIESYEWQVNRVTLADGQNGVVCYYFDTTRLRESEEQFKTLANAIPQLAWMANPEGWVYWFNHRWYEYTGATPAQMEGWGWRSAVDPETLPAVQERWAASLANGEPAEMIFPLRGADDVFRRFLTRVQPLKNAEGRVVRWFGTNTDVDELKRAEDALRRSEARFRGMTDTIPQLVWTCAPDGSCNYLSQQWLSYTGAKQDRQLGLGWAEAIHPEDRDKLLAAWSAAVATSTVFDAEARVRAVDGSYRWFKKRAHPLRDGNGVVMQWFGTSTDIEEIVAARNVLARSRVELERLVAERTQELQATQVQLGHLQRMDALGQLAGGIAHDFNNVLQAVQSGVQLIKGRIGDPGSIERLSALILQSTGRGATITGRLLAFSRQAELRTEVIDASEMLANLREILLHSLGAGVSVKVQAEEGLPSLIADKGQLETVLINLATNARDAMHSQGRLTLSAAYETCLAERQLNHSSNLKPGPYVRLSVSDTGAGMSPEVLAKATEPFFTTKAPGRGTGLGLAMARGFAEQSGGGLRIDSTEGQGTTVHLWLPAGRRKPDSKGLKYAPRTLSNSARIMVVDDERLVLEGLSDQLKTGGYEVLSFPNSSEALAALDAGAKVDLIISDLSMPGIDGVSFLREAQKRLPRVPAILLTGFASIAAASLVSGAVEGPVFLLRKPVTEEALFLEIAQALEHDAHHEPHAIKGSPADD